MGFAAQLETLTQMFQGRGATQMFQGHRAEVRTSGSNGFLSCPAGGIPLQQLSIETRPTLSVAVPTLPTWSKEEMTDFQEVLRV